MQTLTKVDRIIVVLLIAAGAVIAGVLETSLLVAGLLFFAPACLYVMIRAPYHIGDAAIAALLFGGAIGFIIEFYAQVSHSWQITDVSVLSFSAFGEVFSAVPLVYHVLQAFCIFMLYESWSNHTQHVSPRRVSKWIIVITAINLLVIVLMATIESFRTFDYGFSAFVLLTIMFLIILKKYVSIQPRAIAVPVLLYIATNSTLEYLGRIHDLWIFPSQYIGTISYFGNPIPLEEIVSWLIILPFVKLYLYESLYETQ